MADDIADLYLEIKKRAEAKLLVDQANEVPHFSLRTLTRVLTYTNDVAPFYGLERAVYEGFCMGFTTLLSEESERTVMPLIQQHLLKRASILTNPPKRPMDGKNYVNFKNTNKDHQYWLLQGNETPIERPDYVITPYVERNLLNLVRATSTRRYPILIQGPTSAGKTSMIEYLANYTGNKFVRINNHEHTDLQEYLGTYVSDSNGKLKFQEGVLVQAMREGSWIVLDELNLAPTDVLEALNRLLDDNRELLIPETQEIVRPAENFCLFATQNPPGLYGGRKVLSRAFRNRFLELHYDDIPESELETILQKRSRNTAPSDCRRIVQVYKQLTRLRQESRVFEQKNSFATLRDLFRWALRAAETRQDIADHGFMLLAERVRKPEEREEVKKVIEEVFKVKINPDQLYDRDTAPEFRGTGGSKNNSQGVIWTRAMRRLYVLVKRAIVNNEPVLLVGETGCGKTTVVQLLAEFDKKELHIVNAHQNTETGDLIGSQRPVRNRGAILDGLLRSLEQAAAILGQENGDIDQMQAWYNSLTAEDLAKLPEELKAKIQTDTARSKALFEWSDGSLVHAMREGSYFLLDEISLADDSVLERLNSVLEPARTLLLAEKGVTDSFVVGGEGFQFFATMNPGGDFGKRELSPALRNRFTEIWVPAFTDEEDVHDIVVSKLDAKYKKSLKGVKTPISRIIVNFSSWFGKTFRSSSTTALSVRDILAWVQFMNICNFPSVELALLHGAAMVFIDTIGANPSALIAVDPRTMDMQRQECLEKLSELCGSDLSHHYFQEPQLNMDEQALTIGDFSIERLPEADPNSGREFGVPTTKMNAMRVIRALQGTKPILLEGNPGVGKTTLVTALARACGRPLTRINLSDQTDLMDLFGTDVPVEGAEAGNFCWKNAPFLEAMQNGSWVLLDEMNLASQTVLEGLNACLDHRGEVYISELDQVFKRHPDFKLFAAQNPHSQGGGRKGLPSSFVNRFIVVYSDVFTKQDLLYITAKKFDKIGGETQTKLIEFMSRLDDAVVTTRLFGAQGSPWEFNLRDTLRWGDLLTSNNALLSGRKPDDYLDVIIRQRFRTERDRVEVDKLFTEIFQRAPESHSLYHDINSYVSQVGLATLQRNQLSQPTPFPSIDPIHRLKEIESILIAVEQDLPCILVGPSGSGKSALLNHVAAMAGRSLVIFPLNADVDTMDLIGGFEQADPHREVQANLAKMKQALQDQILQALPEPVPVAAVDLMGALMALSGEHQYPEILRMIENLLPEAGALAPLLSETAELLRKPLTLENPRFEWLDGVIVRAVETGAWLVLDNANLCSASVLDRLNSLLERPNGSLSINEHSGPGGEPRILIPHPDFRIFLTVDPRYGELSRAMRNRSVEIYLNGAPWEAKEADYQTIAPVDGSLQRFHTATRILNGAENADVLAPLAFDVLSLGDTRLLEAFMQASTNGLIKSPAAAQRLAQLLSYISAEDASALRQAVASLYDAAPNKMLMPLHPLLNSPMIPLLEQDREGLAAWIAGCYELYLDIQSAQSAMEAQLSKVNVSKPSQLNRLQRSWIADKVASLSRDSTVNAARFLASLLKLFKAYMSETINESRAWKERRAILRRLMLFWKRTFEALIVPNAKFEEARFQAHLTQGSNLLRKALAVLQEADDRKMLATILEYLERDFVVGFKLSTGLSMEALWNQLRPEPVADQECLKQVIEMERLADRFDSLRWKADASIPTLRSVQEAMARAYTVVRSGRGDASALVKELESEISTLEARIGQHPWTHEPFFASTFEALRQALVLHQVADEDGEAVLPALSDIDVLSNLPTVALMRLRASRASPLQLVDCLLAQDSEVRPWTGTLSRSLLLKYDATSSASMHELHSLETELPIMGKILAKSSDALATDSLKKTERLLLKLMEEVMAAHGDACKGVVTPFFQGLLDEMTDVQSIELASLLEQGTNFPVDTTNWPQHLVVIFEKHFYKALRALAAAEKGLQPRSAYTSVAWVQFSLATIKLFVPDKIFDPHHRAEIEQEEHREIYESLQQQIAALEAFELAFTGQRAGLRCKLLMEEVTGLGEPPAVQSIYRPGDSELRGLQGEFNNVLNALVQNDVAASHLRSIFTEAEDASEELSLVERNLVALVGRFIGRFNAYQDLTMPLVSFLRCLQLGLSLGQGAVPAKNTDEVDFKSMVKVTPFLSGTVWEAEAKSLPLRSLEFLSFVQAIIAVESIDSLPENLRQAVHESFFSFHEEWSKKLEADRKAEEAKNSLFRFKGSLEDEEAFDQEEFDQLFPDYVDDEEEQDTDAPKKKKQIPRGNRDLSILLAEAHEKIFLSPQEPQQSIRTLLTQVARRIARAERNSAAGEPEMDALLLPATILAFEDQIKAFSTNVDSNNYNFYTDSILVEVRKALTLVTALKKRFQELQTVDEIGHHQTLADVVMACDKVLDMSIDDPLAAIITPMEKLYAHVYEWHEGGWATKAHKATVLYEKLRDIICDWRRLELSSWSRLLDAEAKKCHDDAKSWWFIAYGAVILQPCSWLQEGKDLYQYAVELLGALESYFNTASLGQFTSRLNLLRQLKNQLELLMVDEPQLRIIRDAVQNFITYHARYERKVKESIAASRTPLDRKMKDVLLLSKWRDKNIEALRASARKSHQKLFKLVRKFRGVLSQPVSGITEQGLPEEEHKGLVAIDTSKVAVQADQEAIALVSQLIPSLENQQQWTRITNLPGVLKMMNKFGSLPASAVEIPGNLDEYITSLVTEMAELRKETPQHLTDENKEAVAHLKTRKTKLYTDTLKTLREMGFSRNLGTTILDRQKSAHAVLVHSGLVPHLSETQLNAIEYFYHKMLDLAPKFRQATFEHNDDLNREVVHRSIGFLEGILYVMFKQRMYLSRTAEAERALHQAITFAKEVSGRAGAGEVAIQSQKSLTNHGRVLRWLVQILKFAVYMVDVHSKLGETSNDSVRSKLQQWLDIFATLATKQDNLPRLPTGFSFSALEQLHADAEKELTTLRNDLNTLLLERPDMAFVIRQVQLWTSASTVAIANELQETTLDEFAKSALDLSSRILVALQKFPEAVKSLPQSQEDAGWFLAHSEGLEKAINTLSMPRITSEVDSLLRLLKASDLSAPTIRDAETALLRAILPMLEQYAATCQQNLAQYADLHRSTCRLGYTLSNSFIVIAKQGFCSPQEESKEKSGEQGDVQSGTGLGDGEGAEDISKDIKDDEDLSELAQDQNNKNQNDIEDNPDAVDMGEDDLEGDMGSVKAEEEDDENKKDKDGDEDDDEDDEMEEEAGGVDELDPTAVDEKMWDGKDEEDAEKDQKGENNSGKTDEDEQAAAEPGKEQKQQQEQEDANAQEEDDEKKEKKEGEDEEEDEDEGQPGEEQEGDAQPQEELSHQDQNVEQQDTLALPDDMQIDISDREEEEEDNLDDLENDEKPQDGEMEEEQAPNGVEEEDKLEEQKDAEKPDEAEAEETDEINPMDEDNMDVDMDKEEEQDEDAPQDLDKDEEEKEKEDQPGLNDDQAQADDDNAAPSDVKTGGGLAQDDQNDMQDDTADNKAAQREQGAVNNQSSDQDNAPGSKGEQSRTEQQEGPNEDQETEASAQPFKKLGDALDRWYRNQRDIRNAPEDKEEQHQKPDVDMAKVEFQHLQDEDAEPDTQAMGTANDEEVRPMDDAMAIDTEMEDANNHVLPEDEPAAEDTNKQEDVEMEDAEVPDSTDPPKEDRKDGRSGVATHQGAMEDEDEDLRKAEAKEGDLDEEINEESSQLQAIHLADEDADKPPRPLRDFNEALNMWTTFQTKTQSLSMSLSSQLRLILTPSQSTKLSGSFRTGKRLNIKKIIPYIASSYKRDKIWMRRAIPTKRSYQILLCVDDSQSMGDTLNNSGSAGRLALESLVMTSRALTMLEVGQVGVLGFGTDVFVAHRLTDPFASHDAGARVLQQFTFKQEGTDMINLLRRTIDHFRDARLTSASQGGEDLWQLALILSDGLVQSKDHARLRPLLREAMEQRVMVVFIVMDDARDAQGNAKKGSQSVLDLKEARFGSDGVPVIHRYLDSFPFQYYLIVHHLDDLPGALAGLLRSWFSEVQGS